MRYYFLKFLILSIFICCFALCVKSQDTLRSYYQTSTKDALINTLVDELILLSASDDSFIAKSSLTGIIAWQLTGRTKGDHLVFHQEDAGLYGTDYNEKYYGIATGDLRKGAIKIFDKTNGKLMFQVKNKNQAAFKDLKFSKKENIVYAVDDYGTIQIIDFISGRVQMQVSIAKGRSILDKQTWAITTTKDEKLILVSTVSEIIVYSLEGKRTLKRINYSPQRDITEIIWSHDFEYFAIAGDSIIRVYNNKVEEVKRIHLPYRVQSVTFSPNSRWICFSNNGYGINYWSFLEGNDIRGYPMRKRSRLDLVPSEYYQGDESMYIKYFPDYQIFVLTTIAGAYTKYYND